MSYLKAFQLGIAPHLLVVFGLVVDGVDHDEAEVPVVDLLLEGLDEGHPVALFKLFFVGVLEK